MPIVGEIKKAREIGKSGGPGASNPYMWCACDGCGKERWVAITRGVPDSKRCISCALKLHQLNFPAHRGEKHHRWKGGRKYSNGYILVTLQPDDFFWPMADCDNHVFEHRLVMAKHLSRCLLSWEIVHHRNGVKNDNRIENLRLIAGGADHISFNRLQAANVRLEQRVTQLEQRITLLEAENVLLKVVGANIG